MCAGIDWSASSNLLEFLSVFHSDCFSETKLAITDSASRKEHLYFGQCFTCLNEHSAMEEAIILDATVYIGS